MKPRTYIEYVLEPYKGLGAIRAKIGPTSDVDKISSKCIHNMCFSEINTVT